MRMIEVIPLLIVTILICLDVAFVIVEAWRHIVFFVVQCTAVLIACNGLLLPILSVFWPELPMMQAMNDILMLFFDPFSGATARLVGVLLIFAGVPPAVLFRALCFRLMPWLEVFTYPSGAVGRILGNGHTASGERRRRERIVAIRTTTRTRDCVFPRRIGAALSAESTRGVLCGMAAGGLRQPGIAFVRPRVRPAGRGGRSNGD